MGFLDALGQIFFPEQVELTEGGLKAHREKLGTEEYKKWIRSGLAEAESHRVALEQKGKKPSAELLEKVALLEKNLRELGGYNYLLNIFEETFDKLNGFFCLLIDRFPNNHNVGIVKNRSLHLS